MFDFITKGATPYLLATIGVLILGFGLYFHWSQGQITTLNGNIVTYKNSLESQEKVIKQFEIDLVKIKAVNKTVNNLNEENRKNASKLDEALNGLKDRAKESPQMVEDLINKSTVQRLQCLEAATGKVVNGINEVCPHIIKEVK